MDGGAGERAELETMKMKVAEAVQRRKWEDRRVRARRSSPPLSPPVSSPGQSASEQAELNIQNDLLVVDSNNYGDMLGCGGGMLSAVADDDDMANILPEIVTPPPLVTGHTHRASSEFSNEKCFGLPPTPPSSELFPSVTLQESGLLVHYLENLYQWQFRTTFIRNPPFSKDWLLWFILRNRPLYLIVLALSASDKSTFFQEGSQNAELTQGNVDRHRNAMQEFQLSLQQYQLRYTTGEVIPDSEHLHLLLCISMLIFQEVLRGGACDWRIHLDAALAEAAGSLSLWELTERATSIRRILEKAREESSSQPSICSDHRLESSLNSGSSTTADTPSETNVITTTFAQATLILLDILVSGAYPGLKEIDDKVTSIRHILQELPSPTLLQFLAWPICIAGCTSISVRLASVYFLVANELVSKDLYQECLIKQVKNSFRLGAEIKCDGKFLQATESFPKIFNKMKIF
ncbi:hypothetical protein B7494_g3022 [Chlorociboria aeruginascens]|nr:hypothetical protein B7494_g3022 [Chlorociboria aeruginascens]